MLDNLSGQNPYEHNYPANYWQQGIQRQDNRSLEWFLTRVEFIYGVLLALPLAWAGSAMTGSVYRHLLTIMPEYIWGWIFILKGAAHWLSLYVNGRAHWTPWVRAASCFFSAVLWASVFGVLVSDSPLQIDLVLVFAGVSAYAYANAMFSCGYDAAMCLERRNGKTH